MNCCAVSNYDRRSLWPQAKLTSINTINVYYSSSGVQSLLRMKTSAYQPYFVTRHKKDVKPHLSPTLLFRNRHHLLSTHHHHQILLLSLSKPSRDVKCQNHLKERHSSADPFASASRLSTSTPSASPTTQPHTVGNGQPPAYAPLRMPEDPHTMVTANNNYTQQQIKYTKY